MVLRRVFSPRPGALYRARFGRAKSEMCPSKQDAGKPVHSPSAPRRRSLPAPQPAAGSRPPQCQVSSFSPHTVSSETAWLTVSPSVLSMTCPEGDRDGRGESRPPPCPRILQSQRPRSAARCRSSLSPGPGNPVAGKRDVLGRLHCHRALRKERREGPHPRGRLPSGSPRSVPRCSHFPKPRLAARSCLGPVPTQTQPEGRV